MDAHIFVEPQQGTTYDRVLAFAKRAKELGFDGFFASVHHHKMDDDVRGIAFRSTPKRFKQLTEGLEVFAGLWRTPDGEFLSYDVDHCQLADSPASPKPWQSPTPPIIIGAVLASAARRILQASITPAT